MNMKKIKINCCWNPQSHSYQYKIIESKSKKVVTTGYYQTEDYIHKTTGDIAKEIYLKYQPMLNEKGYIF